MLGTVLAGAIVATVPKAEPVQAACADCERVFSGPLTVPPNFDQHQATGYIETARQSVHAMALREGISHDEAGLRLWWDAFPSYVVEPMSPQRRTNIDF